jgi:hypothetical protein
MRYKCSYIHPLRLYIVFFSRFAGGKAAAQRWSRRVKAHRSPDGGVHFVSLKEICSAC